MAAPTAALRSTVKVSSISLSVSPIAATTTDLRVSPGAKVRTPPAAMKSAPAVAEPLAVVQATVTGRPLTGERETAKVKGVVPLLPSTAVASLMTNLTARSSLTMVPTPTESVMTAWVALLRRTKKASWSSLRVSPSTLTVRSRLVSPAAKERLPPAAT